MRNSERGSVLLEFGLVTIVLFMMIFGIIDFGRALFTYHFVANAAREGARYASVRGTACTMTDCPATTGSIQTYLQRQATGIGIDPSQLIVNAQWPSNSPAFCISAPNSPGCTVQVGVSYTFKFAFPLLPASPLSLSSSSATVITQ